MKVLQVLNHFLPQQTAGTEVYTWALCRQLQKKGVDVKVLIPHYENNDSVDYVYDGLPVHKYAEPSIVDRSLIMGFREPDGLKNFIAYLKKEQPDLIHFHELAGSNGITLKHLQASKSSGAKVIMTFHLAGYTCKTGTLVYKGRFLCNGKINLVKCSTCYLNSRGYTKAAPFLIGASAILHKLSIDTSKLNNKMGTALGTVPILAKITTDLQTLINSCDRVVAITHWYKNVLQLNSIDPQKICFIPQALPFDNFTQPSKIRSVHSPLRLLFLGRLNKFKGLHLIVEALREIDSTLVSLSIFGNSDDEEFEYVQRIKTSNQSNIYWGGKLEQKDVVPTMREFDILCLCSTFSEMSPLVIQEAFAARIPVIASNVYGNAEQITHGDNGLLFKFNDVEDLRKHILILIKHPELLDQMKIKISPPRSFKNLASDYLDLYKSILK
jgi:glycosyltransferase involved in cell wall biosynthesis